MTTKLTAATFDSSVKGMKCLVKFSADWCGPCKTIAPVLSKVSEETGVSLFEVDIDAEPELAERFDIRSLPTVALMSDGALVDRVVGSVGEAKLTKFVNQG